MKRLSFLVLGIFLILSLALIQAPGEATISETVKSEVTSLFLEAEGDEVEWDIEGYSSSGFKVVWSKNKNPEYPTREGDKYNYHSNPETDESELNAFQGPGTYYVRVCEYLGGKCGLYSNEVEIILGGEDDEYEKEEEDLNCKDGDGGVNFYEKGHLEDFSHGEADYYDTCTDLETTDASEGYSLTDEGKILVEYYCGENNYQYKTYECLDGCKEGACVKGEMYKKEVQEKEKYEYEKKENYEYKYEGKKEGFIPTLYGGEAECEGCLIEGECVPIGYRKAGVYCALGGELINQSTEGSVCDNNFECDSNLCVDGECISGKTIQKILNWFRKIFGGKEEIPVE